MIRLTVFTMVFAQCIQCVSQRVFVVDSMSKTPLAFVAVKYDSDGLYTNEKGWFYLDAIKGEMIELSLLGYQTKQIQTNKIKDTIYLSTELTQLNEVIVVNRENKNNIVYKKPKSTNFFGSTTLLSKNELLLILIPYNLSSNTYINDITFYFEKKIGLQNDKKDMLKTVDGVIKFNIYSVDNEMPSTHIYNSEPIKISSFKKDEIVLSLSDESISIPKEGICIGIEMIGYYDDDYIEVSGESYVRPMLTPQKYEHFKAITYKRFSFPIDDDNNNLILMSDFLKRFGVANPKHFDRNLAIGLTLSKSSD